MISLNDLINQIKASNTLEDLQNLKNLVDEPNDNTTTSISVRTLSFNEYNKYIMNETLGGAITKDDVNVWHYMDKLNSTYSYSQNYSTTTLTSNYDNFYLSVMQNNTNNTCICNNRSQTITFNHTLIRTSWSRQQTANSSISCSKTSTITTVTYDISDKDGNIVCRIICNFNYRCSFRPVFQYIDNNKSNNIFC